MDEILFVHREDFHKWLAENHDLNKGIWLRFDKKNPEGSIHPEQALDEALCFGWIDGQLKSIDEQYYIKYFIKRSPKSVWSMKNKMSAERLINQGKMQPSGLLAIELAKKDGRWERGDAPTFEWSIDGIVELLVPYRNARDNYLKMSPSVQRTYAFSYYSLKKPESREKRLKVMVERLEKNLPPM